MGARAKADPFSPRGFSQKHETNIDSEVQRNVKLSRHHHRLCHDEAK
jgi:hypothetical protein